MKKDIPSDEQRGRTMMPDCVSSESAAASISGEISPRSCTENELRKAEKRYEALFENANDAIFIVRNYRFSDCNRLALKMYRFEKKEDIINCPPWELSPRYQPDGSESEAKAREVMDAALEGTPQRFYWKHARRDGTCFDAEVSLSRIDVEGQAYLQSIVRDVTGIKQAEDALRENMAVLAEAERIGHTGSWKMDLEKGLIIVSDETRRIFGRSADEEIRLKTLLSLIHPEDLEDFKDKVKRMLEKGHLLDTEFRIVLPDGTVRHIYDKGEAVLGKDGRPVVINGVILDITERKRLEDNLIKMQRLESIGILAGGIAHDYNNLLTVIMGNIDLAKLYISNPEKALSLIAKAEEATASARNLTRQLLTFAQGGSPVSRIVRIMDLVTQSVQLSLSGSALRSDWKVEENLPEVKVDEHQICQVVQNIVINAREAMTEGGTLHIEVSRTFVEPGNPLSLAPGTYVRLLFRDEGRGIPADNLPRVFDPYFTTKSLGVTKGLGLGLSICYSIIKQHLGHIALESQEGSGTTVVVHIPAAMAHVEM